MTTFSNPTIRLLRGFSYTFNVNVSGHPFWIQTSSGAYNSSNVLGTGDGVTNNGAQSGIITNEVPFNAQMLFIMFANTFLGMRWYY